MEPQAFDLLLHLIRRREQVVSRDELIEQIWGGRIVSESALSTRINAVRKAIGDTGAEQRLIKTLPRKGVRFVGEVRESQDASEASDFLDVPKANGGSLAPQTAEPPDAHALTAVMPAIAAPRRVAIPRTG